MATEVAAAIVGRMRTPSPHDRPPEAEERLWWRLLRELGRTGPVVTDEDVHYYGDHPDEIDAASSPGRIHRVFLVLGVCLGLGSFAGSKVLAASSLEEVVGEFFDNLLVDLLFEVGVALIGAAVTAYLLGVLLVESQKNARVWRQELRRRIEASRRSNEPR